MPLLSDIGEFGLIERIRARLPKPSARVWVPIGDDAAATEPPAAGEALVSTVDLLEEGVDFTREIPARSVGRKAIAVNLSDLAAMGAAPRGVLIAIAAPPSTDVAWVDDFYDGVASICAEHGVDVLGGDLSRGPNITIAVTALGSAPRGKLVKRDGAKPGDLVCVTGTLGDAAAGLEKLRAGAPIDDPLVKRQIDPTPRVAAGIALAGVAHAMIDVSDGFLADLGHVLDASHVGARIEVAKLPMSDAFRASGLDTRRLALAGGEDFELLFAIDAADEAAARAACGDAGMTVVGAFHPHLGTTLVRPDGTVLPPPSRTGYSHF